MRSDWLTPEELTGSVPPIPPIVAQHLSNKNAVQNKLIRSVA